MLLLKAVLAFSIASSIAWAELVTSRYPRTIRLFWRRSAALWTYAGIYGLIAAGFALAYEPLARAGLLRIGPASGPPAADHTSWWVAAVIGLTTRALLHIRIFSVASAGWEEPFPVGTETLVQLFEPWLLDTIALDDYNAVSAYVSRKTARHRGLEVVKKKLRDSIPVGRSTALTEATRTILLIDIEEATTVPQALESYLRAFGVAAVEQRFPG